jgi:heavy metal sensor kinase
VRPPPIRVRLTAWYLAVIFASLALFCVGTYFGLRAAIEDTVDHELRVRSDNIEKYLQANRPPEDAAASRILPEGSGLGPGDDLYQVTDDSGSMVYQSSAMLELQVPLDTGRLRNHYRHRRDAGDFTTFYRRGVDVRVLSSQVQVGRHEYRVQVATIVTPLYEILNTVRLWAWIGLPLIVCVAGIGGYWLSGRAMKPVRNLVLATREISERNLSTRLKVPPAQDELHELANTMNAMLERLEAAFMRMTRFTSDASHELRTPVTVIRTTSEVILERERSAEEYQEMVGQILRESVFTSELIDQLLTLARADAETAQLSLEPTDLRELIEELEAGSRTLAESRGIHWSAQIPTDAVVVPGDRPHLRRLLLILIDNACRYTQAGGTVRLSLQASEREAIIEVTDTGIGVPPEELTHIFQRFYRAANARYFNPEGTGLGLSIAHWIALAHGGSLTARSSIGEGTSVSLWLRR